MSLHNNMPYGRVLFIAPSDTPKPLDTATEADAIAELGFSVRSLQGDVSSDRLFQTVSRAEWDIMHFSGDAGPAGFRLSQGKIMDVDGMLQLARMGKAKLVFINGCSSNLLGQILIDEGVPVAIVTMRELDDRLAKQTTQAFYKTLAETGNLHEAYKQSKPATRGMYQWLSNGGYTANVIAPVMAKLEQLSKTVTSNDAEHQEIRDKLTALKTAVNDLQDVMCSTVNLKRYFLRITMLGWAVGILAFGLFTTVDKVIK